MLGSIVRSTKGCVEGNVVDKLLGAELLAVDTSSVGCIV